MKLNELLQDFKIFTTNEEQKLLDNLDGIMYISVFNERERVVIENLIKKSLVSKIAHKGSYAVLKNDKLIS